MNKSQDLTHKRYKIVISDCHLSGGKFFEGELNPYEDFHHDEDMIGFFRFFSSGHYGFHPDGAPVEVELVLNGDYLDYLNIPIEGEFEEAISEELALKKTEIILKAHKKVSDAIRAFASLPGKSVTYLVGNHDAELFFPKVREKIVRTWDPAGEFPSVKVDVVADRDRLIYENGLEIRHGNQFEASNAMDFEAPFEAGDEGALTLKLPWGSLYVLKVINRLKVERPLVDKVRPFRVFVLFGLVTDFVFTIRFLILTTTYFCRARLFQSRTGFWKSLLRIADLVKQETTLSRDLEREAREVLDQRQDLKVLVMGHTHRPMDRLYADGKQYINTGTWTRMVNLDWSGLGQQLRRTFAYIELHGPDVTAELREWVGEYQPHQGFNL